LRLGTRNSELETLFSCSPEKTTCVVKCTPQPQSAFTDIVGGRCREYEEEVRKTRDIAIEEMASEVASRGGNAVVGVDIDYEVIRQGMLMVSASGTAVKVR